MIIGVPKEVKDHESRVGVTPAGVKALVEAGHKVLVEHNAGELSSFPDDEYQARGRSPPNRSTTSFAKGWCCSRICTLRRCRN